jgi:hypothetical protein
MSGLKVNGNVKNNSVGLPMLFFYAVANAFKSELHEYKV